MYREVYTVSALLLHSNFTVRAPGLRAVLYLELRIPNGTTPVFCACPCLATSLD